MISRSLCRCIQRQLARVTATSTKLTPLAPKKLTKLKATQFLQNNIYGTHVEAWSNFRRFCSTIQTPDHAAAETPEEMLHKIKHIMGSDQCPGCGTPLQASDPELVGYIPSAVLSRVLSAAVPPATIEHVRTTLPSDARQHSLLCQRCFKLVHYNTALQSRAEVVESEEQLVARVTRPANDRSAPLVALLVDLGDVEGSLLSRVRLKSLLPSTTPLVLIATKIDLLPPGLSESRVADWLRARAVKCGLDPRAVLLTSAVTGHNVTRQMSAGQQGRKQARDSTTHHEQLLFEQLTRLAQGRNIVFMGVQNVGKSSLVNRLLRHVDKRQHATGTVPPRPPLTTSYFPGTTLAPIARPLLAVSDTNDTCQQLLYDTPGLVANQPHLLTALMASNVHTHAQSHVLSQVVLDKRINPAVYRLSPGRSVYLGGVARLDYLAGPPLVYFTVFAAHSLYVHETATERAEEVWHSGQDKFLAPVLYDPARSDKVPLPLQARDLTLRSTLNWEEAFVDVVWPGLGWISITAVGELHVRVHWALDPQGIVAREPIMPFESKRGLKPNPRFQNKPVY